MMNSLLWTPWTCTALSLGIPRDKSLCNRQTLYVEILSSPDKASSSVLVVVVYGQGMHPWKLATFLNFLSRVSWGADIFPHFRAQTSSLISRIFSLWSCCSTEGMSSLWRLLFLCFYSLKIKVRREKYNLLQVLPFLNIANIKSIKVYFRQIMFIWRQVCFSKILKSPRSLIVTVSCGHLIYQAFY